jgi:hypothetical protein
MYPTRAELSSHFIGTGIELGVAAGSFSRIIVKSSRCTRLYSVDRWTDHHNLKEYFGAAGMLATWGRGRCVPLRMTFEEALPFFPDDSLDFIYIDGYAREGQEGGQTLHDWWPKLKSGGHFAGHDYHPRWQATMDVVDAFMLQHNLTFQLTKEDTFPSWWTIKP